MKIISLTGLMCLSTLAMAQEIHFDYDRSANFSSYNTYQWLELEAGRATNQLMDQNIKRAVDAQLARKGLRRVESGSDLHIAYQVAFDQEKQFDGFGPGLRWPRSGRVTSSTIEIGKLVLDFFDPARKQQVWRGTAAKTLNIRKDPEKNYQNLEKAIAKMLKNYPPAGATK